MSVGDEVPRRGVISSFMSIKCADIGYPDCSSVNYGATEEALFRNLEYHIVQVHGLTKEGWNQKLSQNLEDYRKSIAMSFGAD
jgi:hypothetical protein